MALAALVAVAVEPSAEARKHKVDPCGELYDTVLTRNKFARLEFGRDKDLSSGYREAYQLTCAPRNGRHIALDLGGPSLVGQAVSLNGRYIGSVNESCENEVDPRCQTQLWVNHVLNTLKRRSSVQFFGG